MAEESHPLPAGWVAMQAPDGTYYHHSETGRSSWAHPGRPLPPGWESIADGTGAIYYYCSATGESSWEWPTVEDSPTVASAANGTSSTKSAVSFAASARGSSGNSPGSAGTSAGSSLGRGVSWEEHLTDSGVPYYYNQVSGELTWARPAAEEPVAQGGEASVKKASLLREVMSLGAAPLAAMRTKGEELLKGGVRGGEELRKRGSTVASLASRASSNVASRFSAAAQSSRASALERSSLQSCDSSTAFSSRDSTRHPASPRGTPRILVGWRSTERTSRESRDEESPTVKSLGLPSIGEARASNFGAAARAAAASAAAVEAAEWEEHLTDEGCAYYYSRRSGELTWERPACLDSRAPPHGTDAKVHEHKANLLREIAAMRETAEFRRVTKLKEMASERQHAAGRATATAAASAAAAAPAATAPTSGAGAKQGGRRGSAKWLGQAAAGASAAAAGALRRRSLLPKGSSAAQPEASDGSCGGGGEGATRYTTRGTADDSAPMAGGEWSELVGEDGTPYWYCEATGQLSWQRPASATRGAPSANGGGAAVTTANSCSAPINVRHQTSVQIRGGSLMLDVASLGGDASLGAEVRRVLEQIAAVHRAAPSALTSHVQASFGCEAAGGERGVVPPAQLESLMCRLNGPSAPTAAPMVYAQALCAESPGGGLSFGQLMDVVMGAALDPTILSLFQRYAARGVALASGVGGGGGGVADRGYSRRSSSIGGCYNTDGDDGAPPQTMGWLGFACFLRTEQAMQSAHDDELRSHWASLLEVGGGGAIDSAKVARQADAVCDAQTFCRWLLSPANDALDPPHLRMRGEDMDRPISDYFINSSHNSYLEGDQLTSRSTSRVYKRHLLMGCRCVEIDCWNGPNGQPIVTHGNTLCSTVPFREVVHAINEYAFTAANPYPVTLSLEVHLNQDQQLVLVSDLREILGEKLMAPPTDPEAPLPSPYALRNKVLVKSKRSFPLLQPITFLPSVKLRLPGWKVKREEKAALVAEAKASVAAIPQATPRLADPDDIVAMMAVQMSSDASSVGPHGHAPAPPPLPTTMENSSSHALAAATQGGLARRARMSSFKEATDAEAEAAAAVAEEAEVADLVEESEVADAEYKRAEAEAEAEAEVVGGGASSSRPSEMCSLAEHSLKDAAAKVPEELARHTSTRIVRVYPNGTRTDSSNYDPCVGWSLGCQMVCMNYQTWDLWMRLNHARFGSLNGGCGYILKPAYLRSQQPPASPGLYARRPSLGERLQLNPGLSRRGSALVTPPTPPAYNPAAAAAARSTLLREPSWLEAAAAVPLSPTLGSRRGSALYEMPPVAPLSPLPELPPTPASRRVSHGDPTGRSTLSGELRPLSVGGVDSPAWCTVHLQIVCGVELPKVGEQSCLPEVHDQFIPHSKARFGERATSSKKGSVSSPFCVVEVHGGGRSGCAVEAGANHRPGAKYTTETVPSNGLHPRWAEHIELIADCAEQAMVSIHLYDRGRRNLQGDHALLAYEVLPMHALRSGYRVVRLRAPTGSRLRLGCLLVRLHVLPARAFTVQL